MKPSFPDGGIPLAWEEELQRKIVELETRLGVLKAENRALHDAEAARHQVAPVNVESEEKFRAIFAQSPVAIVITSLPDGRVADANPAAERMLGRALADVRGTKTKDLKAWADPADRDRYLELLQRQGFVHGFESRMLRSDGVELAVLYYGHVVRIGGQSFVLNSLLDITDRRRAEDELRWRTAFIEAQMDTALDGILMVDSTGRQVFQNRRVAEIWKIPQEISDDPDDSRQVAFVINRTKNPRQFGEKVAYLYSHPEVISHDEIELTDGTVIDRYSAPVCDREGKHYGRLWTFRDVTEQKLVEAQVRHLANFPELNPNPVLEFAADGTLTYHNPATLALAQVVGVENVTQLLPPSPRSIVEECLATDRPRVRLEIKAGAHALAWSFYPIASQRIVYGYIDDITDRQSLEEQLRHSQKMEAIGQLAGGVAHDFNNIITVIKGRSELLQRDLPRGSAASESVREIAEAANRAATLTRQLLAFSRRQVMQQKDLELNDAVQNIFGMLRRLLGEQVKVTFNFSTAALWTHADPGMLEQVLINLSVNARDAMPDGGELCIETSAATIDDPTARRWPQALPGAFVCLAVRDTGTGIPAEILTKIFEPFFTTKGVGEGTGLGLATVYGIVQQHGGGIDVASTVGQGTTFGIYLPRISAPTLSAPLEAEKPVIKGGTETILLVEDEPAVQQIARLVLERMGYRIIVAATAAEALRIWVDHRDEIQLLLTDLVMPDGVNGHELARRLKLEKPSLRIIYSSGYSATVAGRDFPLDATANFLGKPYDIDQLTSMVRNSLDAASSGTPFPKN